MEEPLMYRATGACKVLGYGRTHLWAQMAQGRLKFVKSGTATLFPRWALEEHVRLLEAEAGIDRPDDAEERARKAEEAQHAYQEQRRAAAAVAAYEEPGLK